MAGFTLEQARRLNQAIEESPYSKAELCRRLGVDKGLLNNITGPKALSREDVRRPMLHGDKLVALSVILNRDLFWIMDYTDRVSPVMQKYQRQFASIIDQIETELLESAMLGCASKGTKINAEDFIRWSRESGGEVGRGAEIEEYIGVVEMPKPGDKIVVPLRIGRHTIPAQKLNSTDPKRLQGQVENWSASKNKQMVDDYLNIDSSPSGLIYDRNVDIDGENVPYSVIRRRGRLLGHSSPAALFFAFQ